MNKLICVFCHREINTKEEYIELKFHNNLKVTTEFFHKECFRKRIETAGDMNMKAEQLYQKANMILNQLSDKTGLLA